MAERKKGGITGAGGTNVDPFFGSPPVKMPTRVDLQNMPTKTWGAGDPDYIKKMKTGKGKPLPKR